MGWEKTQVVRDPNMMGPPELSFNTQPASAARLIRTWVPASKIRAHVSSCALGASQALLPVAASLGKASRGVLLCSLQSTQTCLEGQCHHGAELLIPRVQWQEPGLIC